MNSIGEGGAQVAQSRLHRERLSRGTYPRRFLERDIERLVPTAELVLEVFELLRSKSSLTARSVLSRQLHDRSDAASLVHM
jgi:hypothetical protein